jgi:FlaA1/EpsC-like NDP-sugar epimerase
VIAAEDPALAAALLGRPERELLSAADCRAFAGQRVLVTGAGGSIGSELSRRLAACGLSSLTLVDNCELNLFQIEQALRDRDPDVSIDARLLDITRGPALRALLHAARPHVVYHAAAYKHVSMVERDVCAGVRTNVLGTLDVAEAAREVGSRFVLVSSDKASNPQGVMGATKRLAELVALAAATPRFRPLAVRFGNVLGSSGSLVAVMLDRLRRGQAVDLTDPDAERFFMSAREAASLVLIADRIGSAGEIYWLDMGGTVRIGDVVERLMAFAESRGVPRVPVRTVGLRPGEKLREEMAVQGLELVRTRHRRIFVARQPAIDLAGLSRTVRALRHDIRRDDAVAVLDRLCRALPGFQPSEDARRAAARATLEAAAVREPGEALTA